MTTKGSVHKKLTIYSSPYESGYLYCSCIPWSHPNFLCKMFYEIQNMTLTEPIENVILRLKHVGRKITLSLNLTETGINLDSTVHRQAKHVLKHSHGLNLISNL